MHQQHSGRVRCIAAGAVAVALCFAGCATPTRWSHLGMEREIQDAAKRYTQLIRWQEFERASLYVEPEQREHFLSETRALGDIRFTDYEVVSEEFDTEGDQGVIRVTYRAYRPSSMVEIRLNERQEWRRAEDTGHWRVLPRMVEEHARIGPRGF